MKDTVHLDAHTTVIPADGMLISLNESCQLHRTAAPLRTTPSMTNTF